MQHYSHFSLFHAGFLFQNYFENNLIQRGENWSERSVLFICDFDPSGVRALPLGVAAKQSVHYICDYFSFSLSATYFSPRRGYRTEIFLGFLSPKKNKIRVLKKF
jgi:hypothetical protein